MKSCEEAKKFHSYKKDIYTTAKKLYEECLKKYNIENDIAFLDRKLPKEKFPKEMLTDEVKYYIEQISYVLDIHVHNLKLKVDLIEIKGKVTQEAQERLVLNMQSIYNLTYLQLFNSLEFNKTEVLETLVKRLLAKLIFH